MENLKSWIRWFPIAKRPIAKRPREEELQLPMGIVYPMAKRPREKEKLPMDVVYEILLSLPVRTLFRLKCVCKSWNSLLSLPSFQQDHYHRSLQSPLLLIARNDYGCFEGTNDIHVFTYSSTLVNQFSIETMYHYQRPSFFVVQSQKGLVCFASNSDPMVRICNPSTMESWDLPQQSTHGFKHSTGFGLVASTGELKVVQFTSYNDHMNQQLTQSYCHIFNLYSSDDWREARSPPFQTVQGWVPFLHGALHLLPYVDPNIDLDVDHSYFIAAFDIESEKYREVSLPNWLYGKISTSRISLTELGGKLCLSFLGQQLELWLLKDYSSGEWWKEYSIDIYSCNYNADMAWASLIRDDGTILISVAVETESELQIYNPWERSIGLWDGTKYCTATGYVESFASLDSRLWKMDE